MKTATQLIEELNALDEHASIEAKTSSQVGDSLMETVCAYANEPGLGGGYLILGVAPATDSFWPVYEVVGVPDPDQLQNNIASQCASMLNVVIRPQMTVEEVEGKHVIVVFVPEAGAHEKPIHFKDKPLPQSARRRIGSTDQRCTEDDLIVFYTDRQGQSFDEQIVSHVHGSIQIIRYANRLEIRNPGYSLKAEERLGEAGSQTRNPKIAAVLHDVKLAETKGSGIRVMRELMSEHNLLMPQLQSDRTDNSFLALLLFHHFLGEEDLEWLKSFESESLDEAEMKAMISAREVGAIDNSTFRSLNRDSDTLAASRHLRRLVDCGLLRKKGSGPKTYYVPTDRALHNWPPAKQPARDGLPPELDGLPPELDGLPPELEGLPPELAERISGLGKRGKPEDVLDVVLGLLKWQPLSLAQLAALMGRSQDHIRKTYLNNLVAADLVYLSNPETPNDPRQTYFAKPTRGKQQP